MSPLPKYFSLISLGCPKNLIDSEIFFTIFQQAGYVYTQKQEQAEAILINTCGFIKDAQEESVMSILEASVLKKKKLKKLIITGCLVKRFKESLAKDIPQVDIWLDLKDFDSLKIILSAESSAKRTLLTPRHYAYLRVSDGCNNRCSYCAIPDIRGNHKSEKLEALMDEAKYLASLGVKELIINAQDTTMYGVDLYGKPSLIDLLRQIEVLNLFPWIRLLYLHPAHLTEDMIAQLTKFKTLLPYFDVPLQHINNDILLAMNRKVDKETILSRLYKLRENFPKCAIRTTFITGFPTETKQQFIELKAFIKEFRFTRLGIFTYSPETGTPAFDITPKVLNRTAQYRKDSLMALQQSISAEIMASFKDRVLDVIIDSKSKEKGYTHEGRAYLDAPEIDGKVYIVNGNCHLGDIVKVKITETWEYDLVGEII